MLKKLVGLVTDQEVNFDELDDIEISAVKEIGNIISGSYLNALNKMTNYNMIQSVPECAIDMAGAILSSSMIPLSKSSDHALLIKTQLLMVKRKLKVISF